MKKPWRTFPIGGQTWAVRLVSPRSKDLRVNGRKTFGTCDYEKCTIYLSSALDESARDDTLLHEIFHAILFVSGAEKAYGSNPATEEQIVSAVTPIWHGLLCHLGFSFPKV